MVTFSFQLCKINSAVCRESWPQLSCVSVLPFDFGSTLSRAGRESEAQFALRTGQILEYICIYFWIYHLHLPFATDFLDYMHKEVYFLIRPSKLARMVDSVGLGLGLE